MRFKIEYISTGTLCYLLARQLDEGSFSLGQGATLGGVGIQNAVTQPRKLAHDGFPDLKIFAFQLCAASDRYRLETNSIVELRSA
jgi:hypothetical protein